MLSFTERELAQALRAGARSVKTSSAPSRGGSTQAEMAPWLSEDEGEARSVRRRLLHYLPSANDEPCLKSNVDDEPCAFAVRPLV
jgi:hypothetical protein